jgi:hypothetical protein
MMTKLRAAALALPLIGAAAFMFWQHQRIERLMADRAALRDQVGQAASERDEIQRLAAQIKTSVQASEADRAELMRLRAQSSRLRQVEQENAQLKIEQQRLANQVSQAKQANGLSEQQLHKLPTSETKIPSLPPGVTDLGVVELSNRTPKRLDLGEGKECVVTATVLEDGQLQMVFASESTSPDGLTIQKEHTVTLLPDRQIIISALDGAVLSLTPTLKTK